MYLRPRADSSGGDGAAEASPATTGAETATAASNGASVSQKREGVTAGT